MNSSKICQFGAQCRYKNKVGPKGFKCPRVHGASEPETKAVFETCNICESKFELPTVRYKWEKYERCNRCDDLKRATTSSNLSDLSLFDLDHKLIVTYKYTVQTHSGYCSDPDEKSTHTSTIKKTWRLLNEITDDDLNDDGEIALNNAKLKYYELDEHSCHRGSGYCGCKGYYEITSAVVKKDERKITLGR